MIVAGSRKRSQPAPPHVVLEALTEPNRDPARPWLVLLPDEQPPTVRSVDRATERDATGPMAMVWTSLWPSRPDAEIRFELPTDDHGGTDLRWTLLLVEPLPDASKLGHLRKRINEIINGRLRLSFGQ